MRRVAVISVWCLALGGCLIAESPSDFPALVEQRPTIVQTRVVPSTRQVLGSFPSELLVPVSVIDSEQTFEWRVLIDFDPLSPAETQAKARGTSRPGEEDTDPDSPYYGLRRVVVRDLAPPSDLTSCHTIDLLVSKAPFASTGARAINTCAPLDCDEVTWFYSPSGDLAGCPMQGTVDAGATVGPSTQGARPADAK